MLTLCLQQGRPVWGFVSARLPHPLSLRLPSHCSHYPEENDPVVRGGGQKGPKVNK